MLTIRLASGRVLELPPGATLSIDQNNALLADATDNGAYALPFTVRRTPANQRALDFPELLDHAQGQARRYERTDVFDDGRHLLSGTLQLLRLTPTTYELTLLFGVSAVMSRLKAVKLRELALGGPRPMLGAGITREYQVGQHMMDVLAGAATSDYVFAPYSNCDACEDYPEELPRYPNLNVWQPFGGLAQTAVEGFQAGGGYFPASPVSGALGFPGLFERFVRPSVPLVRVAYVVRTMLTELGIPFEEDVFDAEMEQLVFVSNNLGPGLRLLSDAAVTTISLAELLPELTCAELLRKLVDTFYWDLSVSPTGRLRLRRTSSLLALPPALTLTRQAVPGYEVDLGQAQGLATAYHLGDDKLTGTYYQVPDPAQLGAPVDHVFQLPVPTITHEVRLVQEENAFYQHDGKGWKFFSQNLPTVTIAAGESPVQAEQGIDLLVELELPPMVQLPIPGVNTDPALPVHEERVRVPAFGARCYAPIVNCLDRSSALRVAFYRGLQPYQQAYLSGHFPLLTADTTNLQGTKVGRYSLRLAGDDGTVAQWGRALLELRANPQTVTWPVWLDEEQFYQLDLARRVEIDGLHFVVKKISLTFPIRQAAQLELTLVPPKLLL